MEYLKAIKDIGEAQSSDSKENRCIDFSHLEPSIPFSWG